MQNSKIMKRMLLLIPGCLLCGVVTWGQVGGPWPTVRAGFEVAPARLGVVDGRWDGRWERERKWREREWRWRERREAEWRERCRRNEWRRHRPREQWREYDRQY